MLAKQKTSTVTASVTVTLEISMDSLPGAGPLSNDEIRDLTDRAVESFTSVSRARIDAFNEISRVRRGVPGQVVSIEAHRSQTQNPTCTGTPAND